jgi:2-amino-4-hydroxy-6-hydroxymethyldihydropteridine diphosphokinase
MSWVVLGLGTNLGSRRAILESAILLLGALPGCRVVARSSLYATPPLGPPQPDYLNAALRITWTGSIEELLAQVQRVEAQLGRERRLRWGPRTLDIDILHWSEGALCTPELEVPHRELRARNFALAPLLDVAPELAPELAPALHAIGGAPALAQPGWSSFTHAGGALCGAWLPDEAELMAQLIALLVACEHPRSQGELAVRPLEPPASREERADLEGGEGWLGEAVRQAWNEGFAVRGGAILELGSPPRGVLVGRPGVSEREPFALAHIEQAPGAIERRWTIASQR